jgi:CheY-like chemotaxis protein
MKKLKYSYKTATNGLEALEAYAATPEKFGYILMDISMPVMDGLEATRRIRELERRQQLKPATIIALTGLASANSQREAYASGINMYMTKPVRFKELAKVFAETEKMVNPE